MGQSLIYLFIPQRFWTLWELDRNIPLYHELGSKWLSERASERVSAAERASKRMCSASDWPSGWASTNLKGFCILYSLSSHFLALVYPSSQLCSDRVSHSWTVSNRGGSSNNLNKCNECMYQCFMKIAGGNCFCSAHQIVLLIQWEHKARYSVDCFWLIDLYFSLNGF